MSLWQEAAAKHAAKREALQSLLNKYRAVKLDEETIDKIVLDSDVDEIDELVFEMAVSNFMIPVLDACLARVTSLERSEKSAHEHSVRQQQRIASRVKAEAERRRLA